MLSALAGRGSVRGALTQVFLAAGVMAVLAWLTWQLPDARAYLHRYVETNFVPVVSGARGGVDNRLHIVGRLALELLPMAVLAALIAWRGRTRPAGATGGLTRAFLGTGLAGSLPLALSPIQSGFYLVPSIAFFALGFALLVSARAGALVERLQRFERPLTFGAGLVLAAVLGFAASKAGTIGRGGPVIDDVRAIGRIVPRGATVGVCPAMHGEWSLHGYFMLYDRIALDSRSLSNEWFVADTTKCLPPPWYRRVDAPTRKLTLYRAP
jgi:hypothetical protein